MMQPEPRGRADVTLREVAEAAGVHAGTVSRALSPATRHLVNSATALRVEEAVAKLGYQRNQLASGLKTRRSSTIGVLLPDLTNPLFPPIVRGIEDRLDEAGYTALVANTEYDAQRARQRFETLRARQVDGFILASATRHDPLVAEAVEWGIPVVLVNRRVDDPGVSAVVPDDHGGAEAAYRHLFDLGHRHIGHIAGPLMTSTGQARLDGFVQAAGANGLDVSGQIVIADAFTEEAGAAQAETLLRANPEFTAIVAANDLIALGCLTALAALGRSCPGDVSIVGFNDMPFIDKLSPPLTTVRVHHEEMGAQAAALLLAQIEDPDQKALQIVTPVDFIVRGSTAPPR